MSAVREAVTPLSFPMIEVEEACALVRANVQPLPPRQVPFTEALGCILAQDVVATEDLPSFPASVVDGYALRAADGQHPRHIRGSQTAGYVADVRVEPGDAVWVTTGAPIPPGADAVVKVEETEEVNGRVVPKVAVRSGDNIRPVGHDLRRGERILARGDLVGPAEIGLLAAVNALRVQVVPRPRVAVMSTGDELREPGIPLAPGQIRDSNRYTLMAAVQVAGGIPIDLGPVRDVEADLSRALDRGLADADAVVTSGGVSMGNLDLLKPILAARGQVHFGRVRVKPGKPVTFATVSDKPVFALPGNPVSALVSFHLYVAPALRILAGDVKWQQPRVRVRLAHAVHRTPGRVEFQRARVWRDGKTLWARTTGVQSSSRLASMAGADVLLRLEADVSVVPAGTEVTALLLTPVPAWLGVEGGECD